MKKSTILIILIVYVASIVAIGFFGMASKVYNVNKYVESIEISIEAENDKMFKFYNEGLLEGKKHYKIDVYYSEALTGEFENKLGIMEERKYIPLTIIPHVTYDTGDVANTEEESIVYILSEENKALQEKEYIKLTERGELTCFRIDTAFRIYVEPASSSSNTVGVIIDVYVV